MPIMVNCSCGNVMSIVDEFAGKTVVCNQCQRVVPVPAVGPAAQAPMAPGQSAPNPYLAQNAGYAAAAQPAGYSQAPSAYYTRQQMGERPPSRGLLIAGGVITIIASLLWALVLGAGLVIGAAASGGAGALANSGSLGVFAIIAAALASVLSIATAAIAFAAKPWAAVATALLDFGLVAFAIYPIVDAPEAAGVFGFFGALSLLGGVFAAVGIGQAKRYRAWKGA
jgi:hypothetical protein